MGQINRDMARYEILKVIPKFKAACESVCSYSGTDEFFNAKLFRTRVELVAAICAEMQSLAKFEQFNYPLSD